jgi:hypothetical protein
MQPTKRKARVAGALYLLLAISSIFGLVYVPSKLIVRLDAIATIRNIEASPTLFRLGIASNLFYLIVFVFLVLAFYDLLRDVARQQARAMVALVLVAIPAAFINELNRVAVQLLLGGGGLLSSLDERERNAAVQLFLDLYEHGSQMVMLFWGLWLFPLGLLVVKSKFIPRVFGYFLIVGCLGYVFTAVVFLMSPHDGRLVFPVATLPSAVAEVAIILWLLIKGVRDLPLEQPSR